MDSRGRLAPRNARRMLSCVRPIAMAIAIILAVLPASARNPNDQLCFPRVTWFGGASPNISTPVTSDSGWNGAFRYTFNNGSPMPDVVLQGIRDSSNFYISVQAYNMQSWDPANAVLLAFDPDGNPAHMQRVVILPVQGGATERTTPGTVSEIDYSQDSSTWNSSPVIGGPGWLWPSNALATYTCQKDTSNNCLTTGYEWTLAIKLPITTTAPNTMNPSMTSAIDAPTSGFFGFYVNVVRVIDTSGDAQQSYWPNDDPTDQALSGCSLALFCSPSTLTPAPQYWGNGTQDPSKPCGGVSLGSQNNSIYDNSSTVDPTKIALNASNTFYAAVQNSSMNGSGTPIAAHQVNLTFRIADFGLPSSWDYVPTTLASHSSGVNTCSVTAPNPTIAMGMGPSSTVTFSTGPWCLTTAQEATYLVANGGHQCIQVQMGATPPSWQASHNYLPADQILDPAGHTQEVTAITGSGTSNSSQPSWNDALGPTSDNQVTWTDQGLFNPLAWQPSHSYALNAEVLDPMGHTQEVTVAGVSGGSSPSSWNDSNGSTTDNTVTWTDQGIQQNTYYVENAAVQNMNFGFASVFDGSATISARGYSLPSGQSDQIFELQESRSLLGLDASCPENGGKNGNDQTRAVASTVTSPSDIRCSQMTYVVHGCRRTGAYITLGNKKYHLCDGVGAFGFVVKHNGYAPNWTTELSGSGNALQKTGSGSYEIHVPYNGVTQVIATVTPAAAVKNCSSLVGFSLAPLFGGMILVGLVAYRKRKVPSVRACSNSEPREKG